MMTSGGNNNMIDPDVKSWDDAVRAASEAEDETGESWIPTETSDPEPYKRYGVVRVPKVGDPVSYAFNGDCYPDGHIVSVGSGVRMTVTTTSGRKYNRFRKTGCWRSVNGGTWSLVQGYHEERNPHF